MRTYWGRKEVFSKISCNPLDMARILSISSRLARRRFKLQTVSFKVALPASILDISKISLINASKCSPERMTIPKYSCCSVEILRSRFISWVKPRMALSGVLNSWLIFAKNSLLARLAASAASLALASWTD